MFLNENIINQLADKMSCDSNSNNVVETKVRKNKEGHCSNNVVRTKNKLQTVFL